MLDKVYKEAEKNRDKNYLVIFVFASHGYNYGGMQAVGAPYYDALHDQFEIIEVEKEIRNMGA